MVPWTSLPPAQQQVLAAFVVVPLVLIGWGALWRRLVGTTVRSVDELFDACGEGWAVLLGALQIWHLVAPVDARATTVAVTIGGLGLVAWGRRGLAGAVRGLARNLPAVVLALAAAYWLSGHALGGPRHGDSGGYYIPTTIWMHDFPVVIGLGNLSAPYAYNISYFLWAAVLAVGPFAARSWHLVNTTLMMVLLARGCLGCWRLLSPWHRPGWTDLAYALLLPGEIALALGIMLTSPAPDTGIFLLGAFAFSSLVQLATNDLRTARHHLLALVLFASAGWTIKVAFAGMAVALVVVAPLLWWRRFRPAAPEVARTLLACTAVGMFLLGPWLVANVLMSGCPLFPSALGALDVPWRVRLDVQSWIESDKHVGTLWTLWQDPAWVWNQLLNYGWGEREVALPLVLGGAVLPIALVRAAFRRGRAAVSWWIFVPPLVSLLFALRLTPMPRYAGATMWLVGIGAVLLAAGDGLRHRVLGRGLALAAVVAMTVWLALPAERLVADHNGFEPLATYPTDTRTLASGLTVTLPRGIDACFTAPQPCTPRLDPRLALRVPGVLADGFWIDDRIVY